MSKKTIKSALESMMFVWGQPLDAATAADIFDISKKDMINCFTELAKEYEQEGRGIRIRRIDDSFQFVTTGENEEFVRRLCTPVKMKKLSRAALEVLAIIAYRQPVTKGDIDAVRGIKCDRVIEGLARKELVKTVGKSDRPGRPLLYGTTELFLKNFGFESLSDLPDINDIDAMANDDEYDMEETKQIKIDMEEKHG